MRRHHVPVLVASLLVAGAVGFGLIGPANAEGGGRGHDDVDLRTRMNGQNEVPPADPDGRGRGSFEFTIGDGELCFDVRFDDIGTPNRGHIHLGAAGINGGIEIPLFELVATPADPRNDDLEEGRLTGCVPADDADLEAIAANPGNYYCNLHNARFPAGAIRGQLE